MKSAQIYCHFSLYNFILNCKNTHIKSVHKLIYFTVLRFIVGSFSKCSQWWKLLTMMTCQWFVNTTKSDEQWMIMFSDEVCSALLMMPLIVGEMCHTDVVYTAQCSTTTRQQPISMQIGWGTGCCMSPQIGLISQTTAELEGDFVAGNTPQHQQQHVGG